MATEGLFNFFKVPGLGATTLDSLRQKFLSALEKWLGDHELPIGTVLLYDGTSWEDNITMPGWYACNATNAAAGLTPNLEDKFIRGGTTSGGTGGADSDSITLSTANLPSHEHTINHGHTASSGNQDTSHSHNILTGGTYSAAGSTSLFFQKHSDTLNRGGFATNQTASHGHTITVVDHSGNSGSVGSDSAFTVDTVPAYYAVIFIKRVS